jgi:hypothetical protein
VDKILCFFGQNDHGKYYAYFYIFTYFSKDGKANRTESFLDREEITKAFQKKKFHKNPLRTVTHAAKSFGTKMSPKVQRKNKKAKGRVALMKV